MYFRIYLNSCAFGMNIYAAKFDVNNELHVISFFDDSDEVIVTVCETVVHHIKQVLNNSREDVVFTGVALHA
jgi:hypothetical protein